jgi:hypothetical protein
MRDFLFSLRRLDWLLFFAMIFLLFLSASILYSLNLNIEASDFLIFKNSWSLFYRVYFYFLCSQYKL